MNFFDNFVDVVQGMLNKFEGPLCFVTIPYRPFITVLTLVLLPLIVDGSLVCCGQVVRGEHVLDQAGVVAVRRILLQESLVPHKLRF